MDGKTSTLIFFLFILLPTIVVLSFFCVFSFVGPGFDRKKQISNEQMVIDATIG